MDPEIVDARGKEVEILLFRGMDNLFDVELTDADGNPVNLTDFDVTMTIVERVGGTVRFTETKTPGTHTNAAEGLTRFFIPRAPTFDGVTGTRSYTWKHLITRRNRTTDQIAPHFFGDVRVMTPPTG